MANQEVGPRDAVDVLAELDRSEGRLSYAEKGALRVLIKRALASEPQAVAYLVSDVETREHDTVIGSHADFYDLDHHEQAVQGAADRGGPITRAMTNDCEMRVYRVVRDG